MKTRRWEAILHEPQQATDQAVRPGSSAPSNISAPEASPISKQVRLLPGLLLIPSAPARRRSRMGSGAHRSRLGWRLTAVHLVGLCLLGLTTTVALLRVSSLHLAQQAWLAFQTGPVGSFLMPTPTPTPTPTSTPTPTPPLPPGSGQVVSMINSVFGSYAPGALNVARCESGFNPLAWNPTPIGGSHATGVFQILYPSTWNTTLQAGNSPYDAQANILAAFEIFKRDGYSWREWSCKP